MFYRFCFLALLLGGYFFIPVNHSVIYSANQTPIQVAEKKSTLAQELKNDLHTRRPSDLAFIKLVVDRVNNKTLPLDLVRSTFAWARKKPRRKFQYFRFALIARAKKIGITL